MKHLSLVATATDFAPEAEAEEPTPMLKPVAPVEAAAEPAEAPFAGVAAPLRKALADRGFSELTEVQRAVLAPEAEGRDLQISSQTGSGKTVALGLALAPGLIDVARQGGGARPLAALVIVPTRELAVQVSGELEWLYAAVPGLTVECVTGGSSVSNERRRLARRPTVVVGTPGRLLDHIRTRAVDTAAVEQIVLDEADRMLDMGFREELEAILEQVPAERATHLVSATFAPAVQKLARKFQADPLSVEGTQLGAANEDIEHVGHLIRFQDRYAAIVNLILLAGGERTLVFVNTRLQASELADKLADDGFSAAPISGELEQAQRTRTLDAFRKGTVNVLVATDVAARGLDIAECTLVVHTDAPMDSESYTHRAGRTGRAGRKGRSVLLVSPQRRRKVEVLLSRARVQLKWADVPTEASVAKTLAKRERRRLRDAVTAGPEPDKTTLEFAAGLLETMEAEDLVARLVALASKDDTRRAKAVEALAPSTGGSERFRRQDDAGSPGPRGPRGKFRPDRREDDGAGRYEDRRGAGPRGRVAAAGADRETGYARRRDDRRDAGPADAPAPRYGREERRDFDRDDRRGPRPEGRGGRAGRGGPSERFELNWGERGGATPQRVLAFLCRRGDIPGRMIGNIDIDRHRTSFEISDSVARRFEESASRPDSRDPDLRIRRVR